MPSANCRTSISLHQSIHPTIQPSKSGDLAAATAHWWVQFPEEKYLE
jgi:hypothetical protein